ncbi:GNAT family N-acetyltransferase [Clostridium hydrogeniformans]|uniref:GNAT family N-acetyltransferase n=1 Tax=Clostridium hydrogeniformans TaxID=349933 RepID=UPI003BF9A8D8
MLREIREDDVEDLYEILKDPDIAKYEYFYPITSIEEVISFIKRYKKEKVEKEEITWGVVLKETNKLIGTCCIGSFDEGSRRGEVGYDIVKSQWGKGYGTEAVKKVVDFGFNVIGLNRIEAFITPENYGSIKVLKKLNFIEEGIVRERDLIKGKLEDGVIMAMLKRDFKE